MAVDEDVGKGRAGGGVKQLELRPQFDQHVGGHGGHRQVGEALPASGDAAGAIRANGLRVRVDGLQGPVGPDAPFVEARRLPELAGGLDRVDAGGLPPSPLVAGAVRGTMMGAAERHRELVARLAAERRRLHVAQMMGIRRLAAADEARLLRHEPQMVPVTIAAGGGDRQHALVDPGRSTWVGGLGAVGGGRSDLLSWGRRGQRRGGRG